MEREEKIIVKTMEEVMHDSMIPYSEYVIMDRALPRVEDGLKPVQRRVLYSMYELGLTPDKPFRKCAKTVGDCLGKYHPHGDTSVYQALVRMAQPFNMGSVLIEGHGNFGSIDGDGAAAMRYTEARLAPLALELMRDIDKDTVKWSFNFDDSCKEPDYLPGRFPNLLVNGASGIAVGLATNIPPHNLAETIDGVVAYINNPRISLKEMMKIIKAPDFPTGGVIVKGELEKAYETGKGKIGIRAKVHIENDGDRKQIVIDELPFQVNKAALLKSILQLREEKKDQLGAIADILDESDRNGIRGVIKIKKDGDPQKILELLFKHTNLQTSFGINMVAIADAKPQLMGLLDIIAYYVDYQRALIIRRTKFDLDAAKKRVHILEGLVIAVRNIDEVVAIIKSSKNTTEAKERLRKRFELSEVQAQAIIDLRLGRLTSLEVYKLEKELADLLALIERLTAILGSRKLQFETIITELLAVKKQYKEARKSAILGDLGEYVVASEDDEKIAEDCIVAVTAEGDIKKMSPRSFGKATRDFTETSTRSEMCDIVLKMPSGTRLSCFTNLGNCYKLDAEDIPEAKWRDKPNVPLKKLIPDLAEGERIIYALPLGETLPKGDLLFYTREGMVKRSSFEEYKVIKSSYQAIKLKEGDEVIGIERMRKNCTLMFVTERGMCLNADMSDIPAQGRISAGVKGIKLGEGDRCIMAAQISPSGQIALLTDTGLAKRVAVSNIDAIGRYSKGVKIIDLKNDAKLIFAKYVTDEIKLIIEIDDGFMQAFSSDAFSIETRTHGGRALFRGKSRITDVMIYNDKASEII